MRIIELILIVFTCGTFLLHSGCHDADLRLEPAYAKSVAWLWDQQSPDGAWHSQTHHVLSDGKVLTPYILFYLLQVPEDIYTPSQNAIDKAISFIRQEMWRASVEFCDSLVLVNYPNYSAAYALRVLIKTQTDAALQKMIAAYLRDQQFIEHRGIGRHHIAYGGWGYGEPNLKMGECGHVDLSHTRRVVEALVEYSKAEAKAKAEGEAEGAEVNTDAISYFLYSVQRHPDDPRIPCTKYEKIKVWYDGGFISSMATPTTNKSMPVILDGSLLYYPSYATATCDGLMALKALGQVTSVAYADAVQWLTQHQQIDQVDGLRDDDPEQWSQVMHYYHWAVRAEAMAAAGIQGLWKSKMKKALIQEQLVDGSYFNPLGGVNKEDDPLMATTFCVQAMHSMTSETNPVIDSPYLCIK